MTEDRKPAPLQRELIVVSTPHVGLRARAAGLESVTNEDVTPLAELLANEGATIRPLFGGEDHVKRTTEALAAATSGPVPDLSVYYHVDAPQDRLDELAARLRKQPSVAAAYVKPPAEPALVNDMLPIAQEGPPVSPDFISRQGYLDAGPGGINARHAWTLAGGRGAGVQIIDIEGAWRFSHEDLLDNQGGVVGGTESTDIGWRNHGTAVTGVIGGDSNLFGITGICSDANVRAISIFGGLTSAGAIRRAADMLSPGDIILIELHRSGPGASGAGQDGYIAIEWWPDDFDAIRYAVARGVIVVEAAGNGARNLDDAIYNRRPAGFPPGWSNPFVRGNRDSGAILVGAGAPPATHGRDHGPDRSRLDFSNYGSAVDAQGWGREVTTCAYGDLQGGTNEDRWYTDRFSGTSSASPIVVGSLGCIQGVLRARQIAPLTPPAARALLRSLGSPQQDAPGRPATQRIGARPDLLAMLESLLGTAAVSVPLYRYWNPQAGDHFYTTNWAELGNGRQGWRYEGIQCYVMPKQSAGTAPLHRYWNPQAGDHFYTTNWAELGNGRHGWRYEGIQCYVRVQQTADTVPLHRYWNPQAGDHFYTTNWAELGDGRHGWRYEGIQCYVRTQPGPEATRTEQSIETVPQTFVHATEQLVAPDSFSTSDHTVADSFTLLSPGVQADSFTTSHPAGSTVSVTFRIENG